MMDKFKALLQKKAKEGKFINDDKSIDAKMGLLDDIEGIASDSIASKLSPLKAKKVVVASDSEKGLEKGLEKAKEIVGTQDEVESKAEDMPELEGCEAMEGMPDAESEKVAMHQDATEALKTRIKELEMQLAAQAK